MDANARRLGPYNVSLKYYLTFLFLLLLPLAGNAKVSSVPCDGKAEICASLREALKDRAKETPLKFERIVDGDTFVAGGRKIRVWGIDAPEKEEPTYRVSSWFLESLIKDQVLNCRLIDMDKYQRSVMQCYAGDIDIAATMVKFGMAKDYKKYSGGYYQLEQDEAKKKKRGLWGLQKP